MVVRRVECPRVSRGAGVPARTARAVPVWRGHAGDRRQSDIVGRQTADRIHVWWRVLTSHLWTFQMKRAIFFAMSKGTPQGPRRSEVLQGTLDLMILKTLEALGPLHGFGIARRIEQVSEEVLQLNEGTVYTSLLRLQQQGWIAADWGTSENKRKAKFYSITRSGLKQLARETADWEQISGVIGRVLRLEGQK